MENKYERILEKVKIQFVPKSFSDEQVKVIELSCEYIFNNIHKLLNELEWEAQDDKLVCEAPFIGDLVIVYSYENDRFEVFYNEEFISYSSSMYTAKLAANNFYRSKICDILGLFPKRV